ncbi:hypothetical protein [Kribbella sp. NPDC055071]
MRNHVIAAFAGAALVCTAALPLATANGATAEPARPTHRVEISGSISGGITTRIDGVVASANKVDAYYNGFKFDSKQLCQDNNIGTTWPIEAAGNGFESGSVNPVLVYAPPGSNCVASQWPDWRVIRYSVYNAADGACFKVSGDAYDGAPRLWAGNINVQMNNSYSSCKATVQYRANRVSQATGVVLGLSQYNGPASDNASIMNNYYAHTYSYAGSTDRTNLYWLYN